MERHVLDVKNMSVIMKLIFKENNMENQEKHPITQVIKALETISEACGGAQNLKYYLEKVVQHEKSLFEYAKFKVGDRVKLRKSLTFDDNHGWKHYEHMMKRGAKAIIIDVDHDMEFTYDIEFDKETWVDWDGNVQPTTIKHTFHFSEALLKVL